MAMRPNSLGELQEIYDATQRLGSVSAAARDLGLPENTARHRYRHALRKLAGVTANTPPIVPVPEGFHLSSVATTVDASGNVRSQSFKAKSGDEGDVVPESGAFPAPDGMFVRSTSTLIDGQTGIVKQQWVKADIQKQNEWQAMLDASVRACLNVQPLPEVELEVRAKIDEYLLTQYTLTDCHVGMLAWPRETGAPWDLSIAERTLTNTLYRMIDAAPQSAIGVINQLGDFLHFDSLKAVTPEHQNLLDADSRYQKVVEVAVRILIKVVTHALTKHEFVRVYMHEGNHDPAGSVWLRVLFGALFANNPRVIVEKSPLPYVALKHGKTMLCYHHGHLSKKEKLPLLFAAMFPETWGTTEFRYVHTGHLHCVDEKEYAGITVIQHPTLAAPDAYAARAGYISKRQATSMTYHSKYGEVARGIFVPTE